jgi:flagellar basal-body rod protein FlgC
MVCLNQLLEKMVDNKKNILKLLILLYGGFAYAEDGLKAAIDKAAAANKVQSERIKIISENMANENSTAIDAGDSPYVRQVMFVKNKYNKKLKTKTLVVAKRGVDTKTPFRVKHDPSHPAADINGYVQYPNVNKVIERVDASEAQKSYEANLSIIEVSKAMMKSTLNIMGK